MRVSAGVASATEGVSREPALVAMHEWVALGYLAVIGMCVALSEGAERDACLARIALAAAVVVGAGKAFRGLRALPEAVRLHSYRAAIAWVVLDAYLMLRPLLPLVRAVALDEELVVLDRAIFGVVPALWVEPFTNTRVVVEWFSFCYFSYFILCGGYIVALLWLLRPGLHTAVFSIGSMLCMFGGHLGYLVVPGYGPIVHLRHAFLGPLDGGMFWSWVQATVAAGGAMKDIFPSLHTALPTWFALFAWYCVRHDQRWRFPALATSFLAVNIIISTIVLRWHHGVDVMAGLLLAGLTRAVAPRLARWEAARRAARGCPGPWEP